VLSVTDAVVKVKLADVNKDAVAVFKLLIEINADALNVSKLAVSISKLAVVVSMLFNLLFVDDVYELNDAVVAKLPVSIVVAKDDVATVVVLPLALPT
jgi:hypothetical protein